MGKRVCRMIKMQDTVYELTVSLGIPRSTFQGNASRTVTISPVKIVCGLDSVNVLLSPHLALLIEVASEEKNHGKSGDKKGRFS
jgi:hypothetical protein